MTDGRTDGLTALSIGVTFIAECGDVRTGSRDLGEQVPSK